jgi:hypothetical protein
MGFIFHGWLIVFIFYEIRGSAYRYGMNLIYFLVSLFVFGVSVNIDQRLVYGEIGGDGYELGGFYF